jgi:small GTP-binding protein
MENNLSFNINANNNNELKIIIVGNSGTGKTSYVNKWVKDEFTEQYHVTIVSEFSYKVTEYKGKIYKINIWDLAGMDQNICITKIFSKDAHGCVVLTDITNEKSLESSIKWKESIDETTKFLDGGLIPCILIRNKIDLLNKDINDDNKIKEFVEKNNFINVFNTSAKTGIGIEESMYYLIGNIIDRLEKVGGNKNLIKDRKSIVLEKKKYNDENFNNNINNSEQNNINNNCC